MTNKYSFIEYNKSTFKFGKTLKDFRLKNGFHNLTKLANDIGESYTKLNQIESDYKVIKPDTITLLCDIYKVSIDDLLFSNINASELSLVTNDIINMYGVQMALLNHKTKTRCKNDVNYIGHITCKTISYLIDKFKGNKSPTQISNECGIRKITLDKLQESANDSSIGYLPNEPTLNRYLDYLQIGLSDFKLLMINPKNISIINDDSNLNKYDIVKFIKTIQTKILENVSTKYWLNPNKFNGKDEIILSDFIEYEPKVKYLKNSHKYLKENGLIIGDVICNYRKSNTMLSAVDVSEQLVNFHSQYYNIENHRTPLVSPEMLNKISDIFGLNSHDILINSVNIDALKLDNPDTINKLKQMNIDFYTSKINNHKSNIGVDFHDDIRQTILRILDTRFPNESIIKLAKHCNLSYPTFKNFKEGKTILQLATLTNICESLKLNINMVLLLSINYTMLSIYNRNDYSLFINELQEIIYNKYI